jgi:hypothetical protein
MRNVVTETPYIEDTFAIDYNDWETQQAHPKVKTREDKEAFYENKQLPYVSFFWDSKNKTYRAKIVSFNYDRAKGQVRRNEDISTTGNTTEQVYRNYMSKFDEALKKAWALKYGEETAYDPDSGFREDVLKDLSTMDWAVIYEQ